MTLVYQKYEVYGLPEKFTTCNHFEVRPDSSVGMSTCYRLDGLGIESRWGRDFPLLSRSALGPTQPPAQRVTGLFTGGKAAGAWR